MAERRVDLNVKLAAVVARQAALAQAPAGGVGRVLSVTAICAELGICRETYYVAARRYATEGLAGLVPRSRRPSRSPNRTPAEVEDLVVAARKKLDEEGWDHGAISIASELIRDGVHPPSIATINRILSRRGLVAAQPQKRPKASWKRFNYTERNGCWQTDAFVWQLADGTSVAVFEILDDCTRLLVANLAAPAETGDAALACFLTGVERYGPPAMLLSDNGTAFSGARRGWQSALEQAAAELGVRTVQSSPRHPQTCGKSERAHDTCKKWLRRRPPAATLAELQDQLDTYRELYNTRRPHQSLDNKTPAQAAAEAALATPPTRRQPIQQSISRHKVTSVGQIKVDGYAFSVGKTHAGATVTAIRDGNDITVYLGTKIIRELELDTSRTSQRRTPRPTR
jgi:transposase InsO family protein